MPNRTPNRRRIKIGATVDPALLATVDAFIRDHPELDRSAVIDDALRLWWAREQDRQMEWQFSETLTDAEREERDAWHRIQDEAARDMFGRPH
jgi:metal-responsive CopG/Arc/MetJ family transcriptional regulator